MSAKTNVTGNRVTIDDCSYDVTEAGTDRFAVHDEFGGALGHFKVAGKNTELDDYGVAGAHPIAQIAKLYRDAKAGSGEPKRLVTRMVCQILTFEPIEPEQLEAAHAYRKWLKTQPGLKSAFFTYDPETKKGRSIRVWSTREQMGVAANRTPPSGASEPAATTVEVSSLAEDL